MRQDGGRAWLTIPEDFSLQLDELHLAGGAHLAIEPNDNRNRDFVITVGRFVGTHDIHDRLGLSGCLCIDRACVWHFGVVYCVVIGEE